MDAANATPSPEELAVLEEVIREAVRFRRLSIHDADDFTQSVHLRLIERNYEVFRRFGGRSSLKTYLRVVVARLLLDWRNASMGKWRASSAAKRFGDVGIELERLVVRDKHPVREAVALVQSRNASASTEELLSIAARLPQRQSREHVGLEALDRCAVAFNDPLEARETRAAARCARSALGTAIQRLSPYDRRLLGLRYRDGHSVRDVANLLQTDVKVIYRRFDRLRRSLRRVVLATAS